MRPDSGELVLFRGHPSWRSMLGFYLRWLLAGVIAGALAGVATERTAGHPPTGWVALAVLALFIAMLGRGALRRLRTTYTITDRRLAVEYGLFARTVHQARLDLVQNAAWRQTPFQRMLGIGSVDFDTDSFDVTFRGVERPQEIVRMLDRALRERPRSYL